MRIYLGLVLFCVAIGVSHAATGEGAGAGAGAGSAVPAAGTAFHGLPSFRLSDSNRDALRAAVKGIIKSSEREAAAPPLLSARPGQLASSSSSDGDFVVQTNSPEDVKRLFKLFHNWLLCLLGWRFGLISSDELTEVKGIKVVYMLEGMVSELHLRFETVSDDYQFVFELLSKDSSARGRETGRAIRRKTNLSEATVPHRVIFSKVIPVKSLPLKKWSDIVGLHLQIRKPMSRIGHMLFYHIVIAFMTLFDRNNEELPSFCDESEECIVVNKPMENIRSFWKVAGDLGGIVNQYYEKKYKQLDRSRFSPLRECVLEALRAVTKGKTVKLKEYHYIPSPTLQPLAFVPRATNVDNVDKAK